MINPMLQALIFLIHIAFSFIVLIFTLRILLAYAGVNYFHPLVQTIVRLTDPIVKPTRSYIPNFRRWESASIFLLMLIFIFKIVLVNSLIGRPITLENTLLSLVVNILSFTKDILTYAIIGQCLLSFIQPYSPMLGLLNQMLAPLMRPIQKYIPTTNGFDFSPMVALIFLQLVAILLINPISQVIV